MLWGACGLGFFAFLRAGEFTVPSRTAYDPSVHLSVEDIAIDSRAAPSIIRLRLKQSKTDPFRQRVDIHLGKTDSDLCPVTAVLTYLAIRGSAPRPPFLFHDGTTLSRDRLVSEVRRALAASGHDPALLRTQLQNKGSDRGSKPGVRRHDHPDAGEMAQRCVQTICNVRQKDFGRLFENSRST